jgi:hypothetical protein
MDRELFKTNLALRNLSDEDPEEGVPPDTDEIEDDDLKAPVDEDEDAGGLVE